MASISSARGVRRILFVDPTSNKRRTIYLGKFSLKMATTFKVHVENLVSAKAANTSPDPQTLAWVKGLSDDHHAKLAGVGLLDSRGSATLGSFTEEYIRGRTDVKTRTTINLKFVRTRLVEYFGADRSMRTLTEGDADGFLVWMKEQEYAPATIGRTIKRARQFWKAAIRRRLVTANPFVEVKAPSMVNTTRAFFVTRTIAEKVLAACPDAEWRLIFALARFGGLRCPSELLNLRWIDVLWDEDRIRIRSPKLEADEDGGERLIPIFPELRQHLNAAWDRAEDGAIFVVSKHRDSNANLRTQLSRIIRRAGLATWPRLFQNLRASRETELAAEFPLHVVVKWLGNSAAVAAAHYLTVTDADFASAARGNAPDDAQATQKATQPVPASTRHEDGIKAKGPDFSGPCHLVADTVGSSQNALLPRTGIEPVS